MIMPTSGSRGEHIEAPMLRIANAALHWEAIMGLLVQREVDIIANDNEYDREWIGGAQAIYDISPKTLVPLPAAWGRDPRATSVLEELPGKRVNKHIETAIKGGVLLRLQSFGPMRGLVAFVAHEHAEAAYLSKHPEHAQIVQDTRRARIKSISGKLALPPKKSRRILKAVS